MRIQGMLIAAIALGACAPTPPLDSEQDVDAAFVLSTNEPFWNALVQGNSLQLTGLEGERSLTVDSNERMSDGRRVMAHDHLGTIDIRVTNRACKDSMSGADFPYTGEMAFDGGAQIMGCARRASDPRPEPAEGG